MYLNLELRLPEERGDPPFDSIDTSAAGGARMRIEVVDDSTPPPNRPVSDTKEFASFVHSFLCKVHSPTNLSLVDNQRI